MAIPTTTPTRYWIEKDAEIIGLFGTAGADKTLRVFFAKAADILVAATDEPFGGVTRFDRFHESIVVGAVAKILRRSGAEQQALKYQKEFDDAMTEARKYAVISADGPTSTIGASY